MALERHPVDSYDVKLNFWEEFPDYKVHKIFGEFHTLNKKAGRLKESSLFMWVLTLCYDRKSSMFSQPEMDKWEVACEDVFGNSNLFVELSEDLQNCEILQFPVTASLYKLITAFEESIDTPLGMSLRILEKKLAERAEFIAGQSYTMDSYVQKNGKDVLVKGTADQLDKMFANTDKINALVIKAMEAVRNTDGGTARGGQLESLGDKGDDF